MDTQNILCYLTSLSENNNREWYHAHKQAYRQANAEFEALLQAMILRIGKFDGSVTHNAARDLTFKLARDTRFSHDKSPYNPAFRAHIAAGGKLPIPVGYYIMIRPGNRSFLGGGLFADIFKDATKRVRDYITAHPEEWEAVLQAPAFAEHFTVRGSVLKNVPAGYDRDHPQAEYLKCKSWYLESPVTDAELLDGEAFLDRAVNLFEIMKPFNDCLNRALAGFQMPER